MQSFDLVRVVEAKAVEGTTLWLRFSDGCAGTTDLSDAIPARFDELREPDYFARVHLAGGGVEWPNGYDCAPEWLRDRVAVVSTGGRENDDGSNMAGQHAAAVPEISRFLGIIIRMYWDEHAPPHFHAVYGNDEAVIGIDSLELVRGSLPRRAKALTLEWASVHRAELLENWDLCATKQRPNAIPPLE